WKLIVIRRPGCQFVPGTMTYAGQECYDHNLAALEYVRELEPDAVVLNTTSYRGNAPESASESLQEAVPTLLDEGTELIALRTLPRTPEDPVTCMEEGGSPESCSQPLDRALLPPDRADAPGGSDRSDLPGPRVPDPHRQRVRVLRHRPCHRDLHGHPRG